jgi:hypothetical protein
MGIPTAGFAARLGRRSLIAESRPRMKQRVTPKNLETPKDNAAELGSILSDGPDV